MSGAMGQGGTMGVPSPFSDAEKIDILRFCGYPAYGWNNTYDPFGLYFASFNQPSPFNASRMAAALAVVRVKLTELAALDAAIVVASDNLDTDQAAVWHRNRSEVADRTALFRQRCREMCTVLGVPPGPDLARGGSSLRLVV